MKYLKFLIILFSLSLMCSCSNTTTDINNTETEKNNYALTTTYEKTFSKKNNIITTNDSFTNSNFLFIDSTLFFINNFNNYYLHSTQLDMSEKYLNNSNTKSITNNSVSSITNNNELIFFSYLNESGIYSFNTITNDIKKLYEIFINIDSKKFKKYESNTKAIIENIEKYID